LGNDVLSKSLIAIHGKQAFSALAPAFVLHRSLSSFP
jgi:hypothetical protein